MKRAAALISALVVVAGCGGGDNGRPTATTTTPADKAPPRRPIPPALRTVESASEDTIDFALAGRRDRAVRTARALKKAADGPARAELRAAGVSARTIAAFRDRADEVARLAPKANLLRVALVSNQAFGFVPGFFALYRSPVPAAVTMLDFLDFEAKLRAKAGQRGPVHGAVLALERTWTALRPGFLRSGGERVAPGFDAHVGAMRHLAVGGSLARVQKEAQHGLDLVDELEKVYER